MYTKIQIFNVYMYLNVGGKFQRTNDNFRGSSQRFFSQLFVFTQPVKM